MAADDDFFGIQQISSQDTSETSVKIKVDKDPVNRDGTDFIDSAFFPELFDDNREIATTPHSHSSKFPSSIDVDSNDPFSSYFQPTSKTPSDRIVSEEGIRAHQSVKEELFESPKSSDYPVIVEVDGYEPVTGIEKLQSLIVPVWKLSAEKIVQLLANQIAYEDDDLIAFDKPYGLAWSGSDKKNTVRMNQVLKELKQIVAPTANGLHLIKSLDKGCSGLIVFAKSPGIHKKVMEKVQKGQLTFNYRAIVKNVPKLSEAVINIPLKKFLAGQDFELRPLIRSTKEAVIYNKTQYRVLEESRALHCAYLEVSVNQEAPHQIRSHLGYGINCPILGDQKYNQIGRTQPAALSAGIMANLELTKASVRTLPLFLHLREIVMPSRGNRYIAMKAAIPETFRFALKRLHLLAR